jgi:DNA-binding transcriptional LysR family regulator
VVAEGSFEAAERVFRTQPARIAIRRLEEEIGAT